MYIPTMFYQSANCVLAQPTGSVIPPGVQIGTVTDGTDSWNYIEVEQGYHSYIQVEYGSTEAAKIVLIGEGGAITTGSAEPGGSQYDLGGGAGGDVIIQDVSLSPGRYFLSASANSHGWPEPGGNAVFRNDDSESGNWGTLTAFGGDTPTATLVGGDGGDNTLHQGGDGGVYVGAKAGGGGAGSTSNGLTGMQEPGIGNASIGGDGGSGSVVTSPFSNAVGYSIVGAGGPGMGTVNTSTPVAFNDRGDTDGDNAQWGFGGSWATNRQKIAPKQSRAFLFIPISPTCPKEWSLLYSDSNACTSSVSGEFYTAAGDELSLGNTLYTDFGLNFTTSSLFRTSGSNEYFSTNTYGEIITTGSNCPTPWPLNYSDTNACSSSVSGEFWTSGSSTLTVGNTLYTDFGLTQTTASLFITAGDTTYFNTDISGEILSIDQRCTPCEKWYFHAGGGEATAIYTPCEATESVTLSIGPNNTYERCVTSGSYMSITGIGSNKGYIEPC